MKQAFIAPLALAVLALASCSNPEPAPSAAPVAPDAVEMTYAVDTANSDVAWSGTMIGVMSHSGILKFNDGTVTTKGGQLTGGDFTVNMQSLSTTDTAYAKPGSSQGTHDMFMGHMRSPDFFAVDSFPTAHFKITSVNGNTATGDLTVRGKTNSEQVKDIVINADSTGLTASGTLTFDRQKYAVAWKSPMKDMVLSNDIELQVTLMGTPR
jgi:polyisoprenoid-binding protein YceI